MTDVSGDRVSGQIAAGGRGGVSAECGCRLTDQTVIPVCAATPSAVVGWNGSPAGRRVGAPVGPVEPPDLVDDLTDCLSGGRLADPPPQGCLSVLAGRRAYHGCLQERLRLIHEDADELVAVFGDHRGEPFLEPVEHVDAVDHGGPRHRLHVDRRGVDLVGHLVGIDRPQVGEADRQTQDLGPLPPGVRPFAGDRRRCAAHVPASTARACPAGRSQAPNPIGATSSGSRRRIAIRTSSEISRQRRERGEAPGWQPAPVGGGEAALGEQPGTLLPGVTVLIAADHQAVGPVTAAHLEHRP